MIRKWLCWLLGHTWGPWLPSGALGPWWRACYRCWKSEERWEKRDEH